MSLFSKLFDLLSPTERRRAILLFGMVMGMAFFDAIGVASILPFMAVLANPETVKENPYLRLVYDRLGFTDTESFLFALGVMVFVLFIGSLAFKAVTTYAQLRFTYMREYSIGQRLLAGYLRQPYEWFLNRHSSDLGKSVLSEVTQVINSGFLPGINLIANGLVAVALLGLLLLVNFPLALTVGGVLGVGYGGIYLLTRGKIGRIGHDRFRANQERFRAVIEAFGGIKDVKVMGRETPFLKRFETPAGIYATQQAAAQVAAKLPSYGIQALAFGGMLLVVLTLVAGEGGLEGALPVMALYAFAGYRLMPALQQVYTSLSMLRYAESSVEGLHAEMMALSPDGESPRIRPPAMRVEDEIRLRQVTYRYPSAESPALKQVDLCIPSRTSVGLVGSTGSGKTTTVDVILGLLKPESGSLQVDGVPVTPDNLRSWQRSLGYVPQHIYLADDSIAANIAFGVPEDEMDMPAVERAARIANLHDFVISELPDGYQTTVGERGVRLSGGQRQRIGIARALYEGPQVLILDEATSALDNLTEQAVMEAMQNLNREVTLILIAHRLSTVQDCDRIFLLEGGCVTASGSYDELVKGSERFRAMAGTVTGVSDRRATETD